jgi:WD40 repeat protein
VTFSPDGKSLATGCQDGSLSMWAVNDGKPLQGFSAKGHQGALRSLAYAADGRLLASAGDDGRLIVWDLVKEKAVHQWRLPGAISGLAFDPLGRHLATANSNGTVYILRLPAGLTTPAHPIPAVNGS